MKHRVTGVSICVIALIVLAIVGYCLCWKKRKSAELPPSVSELKMDATSYSAAPGYTAADQTVTPSVSDVISCTDDVLSQYLSARSAREGDASVPSSYRAAPYASAPQPMGTESELARGGAAMGDQKAAYAEFRAGQFVTGAGSSAGSVSRGVYATQAPGSCDCTCVRVARALSTFRA
jgi:hypothetical protein